MSATAYDMVRVNFHNLEHEGRLKPSRNWFHAAIYKAQAKLVGLFILTLSMVVFLQLIKLANCHARSYSRFGAKNRLRSLSSCWFKGTSKAVGKAITDEIWSAIMGSHGMVCCGADLPDTFRRIQLMEDAARYYLDMHLT